MRFKIFRSTVNTAFLWVVLSIWAYLLAWQRLVGAEDALPIEYGVPVAVLSPMSGKVYVIQGMSDSLCFSSKAYFVVQTVNSLEHLESLLLSQEVSGPSPPSTKNDVEKQKTFALSSGSLESSTIELFRGLKIRWMPGNENAGWLVMPDDSGLEIRTLFHKAPTSFKFARNDFRPLKSFIASEKDRILKNSVRIMEYR